MPVHKQLHCLDSLLYKDIYFLIEFSENIFHFLPASQFFFQSQVTAKHCCSLFVTVKAAFTDSLVGYKLSGNWVSSGQITVWRLHIVGGTVGCTVVPSKRQPIIIIIVIHLCTVSGWSDIHCTILNNLRHWFDIRLIWESDQVYVLSNVLYHAACRGSEGRLSAPSE